MRVTNGFCAIFLLLSGVVAADCPPLKTPPGFVANGAPEHKDYDRVELRSTSAAAVDGYVKAEGAYCRQSYRVADGAATPDVAAVETAYRAQLDALGANDVFQSNGEITGQIPGATPAWFAIYSQLGEVSVAIVAQQRPKLVLTAASGYDYRLVGHMPNYVAAKPEIDENGHFDFHVEDPAGDRDIPVSGRAIRITYHLTDGATSASDAEVAFNYRGRFEALGAQFLSRKDDTQTVTRIDENGRAIWFRVYNQPGEISVHVLEEKPAQTPVATPALKQTLDRDGRVALYINFYFNKATLKPDAATVIAEVVALLKSDPSLRLAIEGHTDSAGSIAYNEKLSAQRAAAVVQALVAKGIAADRLTSSGLGASRPLAGNDTNEGRARNRRVELVRR
jgi:outer membrane protein OmpA-like peptidoglycan-associated protein